MERQRPVVWIAECPCGYVVREATQDEAASHAQRHSQDVHDLEITREQALAVTRPQ